MIVDSQGWAKIPIIGDGTYLYDISYEGFAPTQEMQVVNLAEMMSDGAENCDLCGLVMMGAKPVYPPKTCNDEETQAIRVSLAWGETPDDLDLYSFRIDAEDPEETCLAYYCDQKELCGCMEFTEDVKTGGLNGTESISYCCNDPEYYMIYVDDVSGKGTSMKNSEAKILITKESGTQTVLSLSPENTPSGADARYWLAGCMVIVEQEPEFTIVDKYFEEDPTVADPLYCYNLFNELTKVEEPMIPTYLVISSAISKLPINEATVRITSTEGDIRAYADTTSADGEAVVYVDDPGTYAVIVSAEGYIPDSDILVIECAEDALEDCESYLAVELMPKTEDGSIQLTLDWSGEVGPKDLDLFTFQVSKDDTSVTCLTSSIESEACSGVRQTYDSEDGSEGGESAILYDVSSNSRYTYMIMAEKYDDENLFDSQARVTVSDGTQATTMELDSSQADDNVGAVYWIAGCVSIVGKSYNFIPVNAFYLDNPLENGNSMKLYCHHLIENGASSTTTPEPFCDKATVSVVVSDATTFEPIDAFVGISFIDGATIEVVSDDAETEDGVVSVSISRNGQYAIEVSAEGYISDNDDLVVACDVDDCSSCSHTVNVILSPRINDDTIRIMLGWGEMPNNWDLKTLQTNIEDPLDTCITSSESSCLGTTSPSNQESSYGAETLDITNTSYIYLVYVKNSCGVPYSTIDASHITITDGVETTKSYLQVEYYKHETYWVVGCVRYDGDSYEYREINDFQSEDPAAEDSIMRTYCYDIMYDEAAIAVKSEPQALDVELSVTDPSTGEAVSGVQITSSLTTDYYNYTVTTYTDDEGISSVPVYSNGYYEVIFSLSGYVETKWSFFVDCYGEFSCSPSFKASFVSSVESAGDVKLVSEWSIDKNREHEIDVNVYQLTEDLAECKTNKTDSCGSVDVEFTSSTSWSAILPYSSDNDYTTYMIYLENTENNGNDFLYSDASVLVVDSSSARRVKIPKTTMTYNNIAQVLLFGNYRTKDEVDEMEDDDRRNTVIVELEKTTSYSITELQGLSTDGTLKSLVGLASISIFLESREIRSKAELATMSYEEQRDTLIADLNVHADYDVSYLQSLADFDLVQKGLLSDAYNNRQIRAASFGQSYWIVGCLNVYNTSTNFALVNQFTSQLPEHQNKLLCQDLLEVESSASGVSSYWRNKILHLEARNAVDNSLTSVCVDAFFESSDSVLETVATSICGVEVNIPLKLTGEGSYILQYSYEGFVGYSEKVYIDEDSCGSDNNCPVYLTISPAPSAGNTRVMVSWDGSVEGLDFAMYQINSNASSRTTGCLLDSASSKTCESGSGLVRNIANILDGSEGGTTYTVTSSDYYTYMLYVSLPEKMSEVDSVPETVDEILEFAGWRSADELYEMSSEDKRNTLIVEYNKISSVSTTILQQVDTSEIVAASVLGVFLMKWNIKTAEQLKSMDYTEQQNALADALIAKGVSVYSLEGEGGIDLVKGGLDVFTDEYVNYDSIKLIITNGEKLVKGNIPEIPSGSNYWVIGCMISENNKDFTFVQENLFSQENPTVENGRYCYDLFMDQKKASFPTDSYIETIVYSAYDNTPVMGAVVKAGISLSTDASTGVTNGQGVAYVPIFSNGVYDMVINGDGFENNFAIVEIDCTGSSCTPRVQATLAPNLDYGQVMISLNWGSEVEDMDLKLFYVNAYSSDEYTMADESNQDAIANAYYVQNTMEYSEISGLSKANSIQLTDLDTQDGVSYMVAVYNADVDEMEVSASMVTFSDANYTKKIGINNKFEFEYSLRGVLLFGEWSSVSDIFNADEDEQRNSLIVQLSTWSSSSITDLQALTDDELINRGAVTAFMKVFSQHYSSQSMLAELTFQEQMDAFLYELAVSEDVLNWFRAYQGDWYLTSGDLEDYFKDCETCTNFDIVFQMAHKFSRTPQAKHNWISGCISVFESNIVWVPVGEFVNTIDPFFCHNLVFSDFVATAAPEPEFYDNVGLDVIVRNSQNNNPVTGAVVSVTIDDGSGLSIVADDVTVNSDGSLFIPVHKNGFYSVQIEAEGFITSDFEMEVQCTSADCPNRRLVTMSPTLAAGETRIMLTWETEAPSDIDIHIVSVKKSDHSTCRTYYGNKSGCKKISQDLDNTSGGQNGAETMTLLDNAINKDYVYLIGIEDYNFESNGTPFLSSGATITVTNGVKTVYDRMVASSISYSTEYDKFY